MISKGDFTFNFNCEGGIEISDKTGRNVLFVCVV